jgi:uncharacterized phage-associated protein
MKLQKLVYYSYGWWIAYHAESIISEHPQVWKFGPVFLSLYHALKNHGRTPITTIQPDYPFQPPPRVDRDDIDANRLVDWVWLKYGHYSAYQLSDMTHAIGSPWRQVAEQHDWHVPSSTPIPDNLIKADILAAAKEFGLS